MDYANLPPWKTLVGDGTWERATVIKSSEFSTIAVLVAATAVVVAVQQHRERERRDPSPPAIEVQPVAPSADARVISSTSAGDVSRPAAFGGP
jgi:hypothetical protein